MTPLEIKKYQKEMKHWIPKCDVTMKDVVVSGLVDDSVKIANNIIDKMMKPH